MVAPMKWSGLRRATPAKVDMSVCPEHLMPHVPLGRYVLTIIHVCSPVPLQIVKATHHGRLMARDIKKRQTVHVPTAPHAKPHIHIVVRRDTMVLRQTGHPGAIHAPVAVHHPRAQHRQRVAIFHRGQRVLIPRVRTNIHPIAIGRTKTPACFSPKRHSPILGECLL